MKAIILGHYDGRVVVVPIPKDITNREDAYEYIEDCPMCSNDSDYMLVDDDEIKVLKAVDNGDDFEFVPYVTL